jgi:hypothetical protein
VADGDPEERHRRGPEQVLQGDARRSAEDAEGGFRHPGPQLGVHLEGVHQDGDGVEKQKCDKRIAPAGQVQIERESSQQPEPEQHTDGLSHAHHPRGKSLTASSRPSPNITPIAETRPKRFCSFSFFISSNK